MLKYSTMNYQISYTLSNRSNKNKMNYIDADDFEYLQEMRIILLGRTGGGMIEICFTIVLFILERKKCFG